MTWLFVRMLPSASMMNPVPAPRRGVSRSFLGVPGSGTSSGSGRVRLRFAASFPRVVASMFTTAGLIRSTTSAKFTTVTGTVAPAARMRGSLATGLVGAPAAMEERPTPPATMAPTRKATIAVKASVTAVNRRDI